MPWFNEDRDYLDYDEGYDAVRADATKPKTYALLLTEQELHVLDKILYYTRATTPLSDATAHERITESVASKLAQIAADHSQHRYQSTSQKSSNLGPLLTCTRPYLHTLRCRGRAP